MPHRDWRAAICWAPLAAIVIAASGCSAGDSGRTGQVARGAIGGPCSLTAADGGVFVPAEVDGVGLATSVVRRIDLRTGRMETIIGTASGGFGADGTATSAALGSVCGIAIDQLGSVLVSEGAYVEHGQAFGHNRVRVLPASGGFS
jgi:hypothetical protein